MNSNIDHNISKWDEMFYPLKLQEYLLEMPVVDDYGHLSDDKSFLSETSLLVDKPDLLGKKINVHLYFLLGFLIIYF